MQNTILFTIVFLLSMTVAYAQKNVKTPLSLNVSMIAQGQYIGLKIGLEQSLKRREILNTKGELRKVKEQAVQYNLGFYYHDGFHTNVFSNSEYVFRTIRKSGFFREFKTGLGISRTFLPTTYTVNDVSGVVSEKASAGHFYFIPSLTFGMGKDFSVKNPKSKLAVQGNLNLSGILPYNSFILPTPMLEISIQYKLNHSVSK